MIKNFIALAAPTKIVGAAFFYALSFGFPLRLRPILRFTAIYRVFIGFVDFVDLFDLFYFVDFGRDLYYNIFTDYENVYA